MRQVKTSSRNSARKPASARAGKPFGRRKSPPKPGFFARMKSAPARAKAWVAGKVAAFFDLFTLRHPAFLTGFVLCLFAVVMVVLMSGVVGRTARHAEHAVASAVVRSGFGITSVEFTGLEHTPRAEAMAALGFKPGEPTFSADLYQARLRLMALPWIKDAVLRRHYPGRIEISVTEKTPFALWQTGRGVYLIEKGGAIITGRNVLRFSHLPVLLGKGAPAVAGDFVAAVRRHPLVAANVAVYQYQSQRRWNLILSSGVKVKLPEFGWRKELGALQKLIGRKDILDCEMGEIDLRGKSFLYFDGVPSEPAEEPTKAEGRAI